MAQLGQSHLSLGELRSCLAVVDRHLEALTEGGATSISLPLLGTGVQGLAPELVIPELLRSLRGWARFPQLTVIRVFAVSLAHVAVLNRAIDRWLDTKEPSDPAPNLLAAVAREVHAASEAIAAGPLRIALKELGEVCAAPSPSGRGIAVQARRLAEAASTELLRKVAPKQPMPSGLNEKLEALRDWIFDSRRWVFSYFKLVQAAGNAAAHHSAATFDRDDPAAIALAAVQVARFADATRNLREGIPKKV
jgi:hypothetical protein